MPNGEFGWINSHSQGPTAIEFEDYIRVYFATRPKPNLTLPTFVDLDKNNLKIVLNINKTPILELGKQGTFDEHGIIPKSIIKNSNGLFFLYYIGWSRLESVPYSLGIGLAISEDGLNFTKYSEGPILGIEKGDQLSLTAPIVFYENGMYYMFYTSGTGWHYINNRWEHTYTIRKATSLNGIDWNRDFKNIIEPNNNLECISNPTILKNNNTYHMWYSFKGSRDFRSDPNFSYRIGYAHSKDLNIWVRDDANSGIDISKDGWDSNMIEYPNLCKLENKVFLFYNGNGFGESGFGYAELKLN